MNTSKKEVYIMEREFLGKVTVEQLLKNMIKAHMESEKETADMEKAHESGERG